MERCAQGSGLPVELPSAAAQPGVGRRTNSGFAQVRCPPPPLHSDTGRWGAWPFRACSPPLWSTFPVRRGLCTHIYRLQQGEGHGITRFSSSCHPVLFLKIPSPGPAIHLQSLCLILRTHIIKLQLNSMKIIPTITVVANLSLARAKVARQRQAITCY